MSVDLKTLAAQMREAAPVSDDSMKVSKALWLQIADAVEKAGEEILCCEQRDTSSDLADARSPSPEGKVLAVPCLPGTKVRFKGLQSPWKVVCINFYAEGIPTASVTNGKITSMMPLTDLTEAEVLE